MVLTLCYLLHTGVFESLLRTSALFISFQHLITFDEKGLSTLFPEKLLLSQPA
ncbi:hypothetical protein MNV_430005 [Candidatus Methanoperedens nitroreducens]|uniref:Uncharacterized protein n=1 Tax=Candidatus Methanoperedens nitratireducens TaxID=1392998 RepID=A0A284VR30_9EURY|nr:hypothetical protein MNV_430005 [Candidatus Methanoperedens nitroreducens]